MYPLKLGAVSSNSVGVEAGELLSCIRLYIFSKSISICEWLHNLQVWQHNVACPSLVNWDFSSNEWVWCNDKWAGHDSLCAISLVDLK